jgi:hypothetical protein
MKKRWDAWEMMKRRRPDQTQDRSEKQLPKGVAQSSQDKSHPRAGWAEQFALMHELGDDKLLDWDYLPTKFDEEEWEW